MRIKSAVFKNNVFSWSFAALRASLMKVKAADCHVLLRMIGEIKAGVNMNLSEI